MLHNFVQQFKLVSGIEYRIHDISLINTAEREKRKYTRLTSRESIAIKFISFHSEYNIGILECLVTITTL